MLVAIGHASIGLLFLGERRRRGRLRRLRSRAASAASSRRQAPHERAGVLSIVYVVAYLAMGVPAVLAGLRVVHGGGLLVAARELGVVVMALAAIALAGTVARRSRPA